MTGDLANGAQRCSG